MGVVTRAARDRKWLAEAKWVVVMHELTRLLATKDFSQNSRGLACDSGDEREMLTSAPLQDSAWSAYLLVWPFALSSFASRYVGIPWFIPSLDHLRITRNISGSEHVVQKQYRGRQQCVYVSKTLTQNFTPPSLSPLSAPGTKALPFHFEVAAYSSMQWSS